MAHCYHADIESDTRKNSNFRRVVFTGKHAQLVLMALKAGEDIGLETHPDLDQFVRVDEGSGYAMIDGEKFSLSDGSAVVIPAGSKHNVVAGKDGLKLYTVYTSKQHADGAVQKTKAEAEAVEKSVVLTPVEFELKKAAEGDSEYINKDKTFKGGFKGCVRYQMEKKGLSKTSATKLCAYIGRKAGKIP